MMEQDEWSETKDKMKKSRGWALQRQLYGITTMGLVIEWGYSAMLMIHCYKNIRNMVIFVTKYVPRQEHSVAIFVTISLSW